MTALDDDVATVSSVASADASARAAADVELTIALDGECPVARDVDAGIILVGRSDCVLAHEVDGGRAPASDARPVVGFIVGARDGHAVEGHLGAAVDAHLVVAGQFAVGHVAVHQRDVAGRLREVHVAGFHRHADGIVYAIVKSHSRLLVEIGLGPVGGFEPHVAVVAGDGHEEFAGRGLGRNPIGFAPVLHREIRGDEGRGAVGLLQRELHDGLLVHEGGGGSFYREINTPHGNVRHGNGRYGYIALLGDEVQRAFLRAVVAKFIFERQHVVDVGHFRQSPLQRAGPPVDRDVVDIQCANALGCFTIAQIDSHNVTTRPNSVETFSFGPELQCTGRVVDAPGGLDRKGVCYRRFRGRRGTIGRIGLLAASRHSGDDGRNHRQPARECHDSSHPLAPCTKTRPPPGHRHTHCASPPRPRRSGTRSAQCPTP